jgi:hypothetical protein
VFRSPISGLINRTKKIGAGDKAIDFSDPTTTERQQSQVQSSISTKQITDYSLGPPSVAVAEVEQVINDRLATMNDHDDKIKRLTRGFAITLLQKDFEAAYRLIFGSQLDLLLRSNVGGGLDEATAQAIFENARTLYPTVHEGASFDLWLSFLLNARFIEKRQSLPRLFTTPKGQEFMQYLVQVGLTTPKNNG